MALGARFFKTRSLAAEAVARGKVALNDAVLSRAERSARAITSTSVAALTNGSLLSGTSIYRGPPADARALYEETEESRLTRQAALTRLKLERPADFHSLGGLPKRIGARYRNSPIANGET